MSESPPSKDMDDVKNTIQIEDTEKPSDIEGQDGVEEQDKVNIRLLIGKMIEILIKSKMTFVKVMALIAMAFLWTGSQIPLYLYGAVPPYSMSDFHFKLGIKF